MAIDKRIDRSETIGCSDIAVIMGLSPYKTAVELWREKCRIVIPKDISDQEHIEWGNRLEPVILDKYEEIHNTLLVRDERFTHPEFSWFQGNLDGRDPCCSSNPADGVIVEAKTVSSNAAYQWGTPGSCQIPLWYACQAQGYMCLTGAQVTHFPVLIAGNRYREFVIARNDNTIEQILEAIYKFRRCVESMTPPPAQNYKDVLRLWTPEEKKVFHLTATTIDHKPLIERIEQMKRYAADIKTLQSQLDGEKKSLTELMVLNEAAVLMNNGKKDAWVQKGRHGFSLRLAIDEEELD